MHLPQSLSKTTLGDVFGQLYRSKASCVLELQEPLGCKHRFHFFYGLIGAIDSSCRGTPLAEILRQKGVIESAGVREAIEAGVYLDPWKSYQLYKQMGIAEDVLRDALKSQLRSKLDQVFQVKDAQVQMAPPAPVPIRTVWIGPMHPKDFLHGRPRARDRVQATTARAISKRSGQNVERLLDRMKRIAPSPPVVRAASKAEQEIATIQQQAAASVPAMQAKTLTLRGLGLQETASVDTVQSRLQSILDIENPFPIDPALAKLAQAFAAYQLCNAIGFDEN